MEFSREWVVDEAEGYHAFVCTLGAGHQDQIAVILERGVVEASGAPVMFVAIDSPTVQVDRPDTDVVVVYRSVNSVGAGHVRDLLKRLSVIEVDVKIETLNTACVFASAWSEVRGLIEEEGVLHPQLIPSSQLAVGTDRSGHASSAPATVPETAMGGPPAPLAILRLRGATAMVQEVKNLVAACTCQSFNRRACLTRTES